MDTNKELQAFMKNAMNIKFPLFGTNENTRKRGKNRARRDLGVQSESSHRKFTKKKPLTDKQKREKRKVADKSRKFNRRKFGNKRH